MSEAKHILEWYKELPEPYRSAAIANYSDDSSFNSAQGMAEDLPQALCRGFSWAGNNSPGELDWIELYYAVLDGTFVPSSPYPQIKTTFLEGIEL